jgi:hypothetical protein
MTIIVSWPGRTSSTNECLLQTSFCVTFLKARRDADTSLASMSLQGCRYIYQVTFPYNGPWCIATAGCCVGLLLASLIGPPRTQRLWLPVRIFCYTFSLIIYAIVVNYPLLKYLKPDILIHKCLLPTSLLGFRSPQQNEISSLIMATYSQTTWEKHKVAIT